MVGRHGYRNKRQVVTLPPLQQREVNTGAHFLFLIQSRTRAYAMLLCFSSMVNLSKKTPHLSVQGSVFKVIIDTVDNRTITPCNPVSYLKFGAALLKF